MWKVGSENFWKTKTKMQNYKPKIKNSFIPARVYPALDAGSRNPGCFGFRIPPSPPVGGFGRAGKCGMTKSGGKTGLNKKPAKVADSSEARSSAIISHPSTDTSLANNQKTAINAVYGDLTSVRNSALSSYNQYSKESEFVKIKKRLLANFEKLLDLFVNPFEFSRPNLGYKKAFAVPVANYPKIAYPKSVDTDNSLPTDEFRKSEWINLCQKEFEFLYDSALAFNRKLCKLAISVFGERIRSHRPSLVSTALAEILPDFRDFSTALQNSGVEYSRSSSNSSIAFLSKNNPYVRPFLSTKRITPFNLSFREEGILESDNNSSLRSNSVIYSILAENQNLSIA